MRLSAEIVMAKSALALFHKKRVASAALPFAEDGGGKRKEAPNEGPRQRRGDVGKVAAGTSLRTSMRGGSLNAY